MDLQLTTKPAKITGDAFVPSHRDTILVVEDRTALRQFVASLLEAEGYQILLAENGVKALAAASSHDGRIDLVISDLLMPGMTGYCLVRRLAELRPETKILLMSAHEPETPSVGSGIRFIAKPFAAAELLGAVADLLGQRCERVPAQREGVPRERLALLRGLTAVILLSFVTAPYVRAQSDPWSNAATKIGTAFSGPIAKGFSLASIVLGGLELAFGDGSAKRTIGGIIFGLGMALASAAFINWLVP